jgi:hypothetical protein
MTAFPELRPHHSDRRPLFRPADSWSLLGTPLGGREDVTAAVNDHLADIEKNVLRAAATVSDVDTQVAFLLLRHCASFPAAVYHMRTACGTPTSPRSTERSG